MNFINKNWKVRSAVILVISMITCALLWTLSLSDWAEAVNAIPEIAHNKEPKSALIMGFASIFKVIILTGVPATLCLGLICIFSKVIQVFKLAIHRY